MNTLGVVMYRNPVEEFLWENVYPWVGAIGLCVVVAFLLTYGISSAWDKWRGRK